MGLRVLVTGGAGFIGSHLCERLLNDGHEVLCVDDFSTGHMSNISALEQRPAFTLIRHDVVAPLDTSIEVDRIYHLACPASPKAYQRDPIKTVETSVLGTRHVLALAERLRARVLFASTSEIYGSPTEHPQSENYWGNVNPIGPRSCYDESKRVAETLCFEYHRQRGLDLRVIRIFNTYGPRMAADDGRVVSTFIYQALKGHDLTIYGDGSQTRSFCFVAELVEGIVHMMAQDRHTGPINLGNPQEFTMLELAEHIIEATGTRSKLRFLPLPQDDPPRRCPDIALANDVLAWNPTIDLREGLRRTIPHFAALIAAESS